MIINVRGTHGSGKSTVIRKVMEKGVFSPFYIEGRKRPMGYRNDTIFVPGSYETDCGGCDTISQVEDAFDLIKGHASNGWRVLFEGILSQHSAPRLIEVHKLFPVIVLVLTTPVEQCIADVEKRRAESGNTRPFNHENLRKEARSVVSSSRRLKSEGLNLQYMTREEAIDYCIEVLFHGNA